MHAKQMEQESLRSSMGLTDMALTSVSPLPASVDPLIQDNNATFANALDAMSAGKSLVIFIGNFHVLSH